MIKYPSRFNEASPAGFDGIFDWDFLIPAFKGTKIQPMDIDAIVERHGKVLIFETKSPGKDIPLGQQITFEALIKLGRGSIYLMIIYGKNAQDIIMIEEWRYLNGKVRKEIKDCDSEYVLQRVSKWFEWANT